jgi:hypothetical protein
MEIYMVNMSFFFYKNGEQEDKTGPVWSGTSQMGRIHEKGAGR